MPEPITPAPVEAAPQVAAPIVEGTPAAPAGKEPTFVGEFNAETAAKLVANLRAEVASLKAPKPAAPVTPAPVDEATARIAALEERLRAADRAAAVATVSAATSVPAELLIGDDAEAMTAYATKLTDWAKGLTPAAIPGKPQPHLTPAPGHGAPVTPAFDAAAVAKAARNRY